PAAGSAPTGGRPAAPSDPGATNRMGQGPGAGATRGTAGGMLFYVGDAGQLQVVRVNAGISNGQETAISGEGLEEGMQIIAGVTGGDVEESVAAPFGGQPQGGGGFGRGGF
ncbi:MAG: hypothetical protein WD054_06750, partial [Gemmatimonadota bacterium]